MLLALAYAAAGRVTDVLALLRAVGRHGVWLADLAGAERDLRPARVGSRCCRSPERGRDVYQLSSLVAQGDQGVYGGGTAGGDPAGEGRDGGQQG